eukprot:234042-Rhodomonas_salina.1
MRRRVAAYALQYTEFVRRVCTDGVAGSAIGALVLRQCDGATRTSRSSTRLMPSTIPSTKRDYRGTPVPDIVDKNRSRYKGITKNSKFKAGTILKIPPKRLPGQYLPLHARYSLRVPGPFCLWNSYQCP